jgi:hypothetical protein
MKVESPTYSPLNLRIDRENEVQKQQNFTVENQQTSKKEPVQDVVTRTDRPENATGPTFSLREKITRGSLTSLAEALNPEEQAMLQQLFNENNSAWGVNAYESQAMTHKNFILGANLDRVS